VHRGHQSLILRTIEKARADALPVVLITFEPHPLRILLGDNAPAQLMTLPHRLECFAAMGVDLALVMPFTPATAALSPEDFVRRILVERLNARMLVVGYDYAFGKNRRGDAELLARLGRAYGYTLEQIPPVSVLGDIVSSTRIRDALQRGDAESAGELLGRSHSVEGVVEHGMNRGGRLLGFPTANLRLRDPLLLPKTGVYAVMAEINPSRRRLPGMHPAPCRTCLPGVANVGKNPTFADEPVHVETHLLDFQGDIYGASFRTHFVRRLRDEMKFAGAAELIEQIRRDCAEARDVLRVRPDDATDGDDRRRAVPGDSIPE
jgi:riboflavin kinase/FMN adenylyltransferase